MERSSFSWGRSSTPQRGESQVGTPSLGRMYPMSTSQAARKRRKIAEERKGWAAWSINYFSTPCHYRRDLIAAADCRGSLTSTKPRGGSATLILTAGSSGRDRTAREAGKLPLQPFMATEGTGEGFLLLAGSDKFLRYLAASLTAVLVNGHLFAPNDRFHETRIVVW